MRRRGRFKTRKIECAIKMTPKKNNAYNEMRKVIFILSVPRPISKIRWPGYAASSQNSF